MRLVWSIDEALSGVREACAEQEDVLFKCVPTESLQEQKEEGMSDMPAGIRLEPRSEFDGAFIEEGVYDFEKVIEALIRVNPSWGRQEAIEWATFNIQGLVELR